MRLKSPQLNSAKRLSKEAFNLIADVQAMFHNSGDARTASRLIPTAKIHDTFAHSRLVRVAIVSGAAISAFQASQQASTISS
jgi:hypothetical protein